MSPLAKFHCHIILWIGRGCHGFNYIGNSELPITKIRIILIDTTICRKFLQVAMRVKIQRYKSYN